MALAKPPPPRPFATPRGRTAPYPRPFPVLTPQSYVPGGAGGGLYPGYPPMGGSNFPVITPNSYLPPPGTIEPPIMNYSGAPPLLSPPPPYPPMPPPPYPPPSYPPMPPPSYPPMPCPHRGGMPRMGPPPPYYDPGLHSYGRHRPARMCRRGHRSRRCRPVIHIIDSSSCSSVSSCTTISSCSRHRHRSHSHSRRCVTAPPLQPIILLPVQCQQPQTSIAAPAQNHIQSQPQQIVLPPIQIQQPGQFQQQQQQLALPMQQQLALPMQQQALALPPMQLTPSNLFPSTASSPIVISCGQPMIQPSMSLPQIANIGQPQQINAGSLQCMQAMPQCSSPLQYISGEPRSTIVPQHILVNSTKKKQLPKTKTTSRSNSIRDLPQNDLKFGRRPFDWYDNDKKSNVINEKIQVGQRRTTAVR
ncbi:unnamed protein product [Rotaria sp. Silwood2]|nr:unnamed protein product [Rotaria sp. Silwood2]